MLSINDYANHKDLPKETEGMQLLLEIMVVRGRGISNWTVYA